MWFYKETHVYKNTTECVYEKTLLIIVSSCADTKSWCGQLNQMKTANDNVKIINQKYQVPMS